MQALTPGPMKVLNSKLDAILLGCMVALTMALVIFIVNTIAVPHLVAGDRAPGFSFKTDDGRQIGRDDFGGRLLVLNFWASWCATCVLEMPSLNQFAAEMRDQGIVVVAVSVDRNEQSYNRFLQRLRPRFSTYRDPTSDISASFGTFMIPETYVIDRSGHVRQKYISDRNWEDPVMINEVRSHLE